MANYNLEILIPLVPLQNISEVVRKMCRLLLTESIIVTGLSCTWIYDQTRSKETTVKAVSLYFEFY